MFVFVGWVYYSLVSVFFSNFQCVIVVCCFFYWLPRLLCLQGRLAGVGGWDAGAGGGREVRRGCSVGSTGDVSRSETGQQLVSVAALGRRLRGWV